MNFNIIEPVLIRTKREELKYEFCESYKAWRFASLKAQATPNDFTLGREVDNSWRAYVKARDLWVFSSID